MGTLWPMKRAQMTGVLKFRLTEAQRRILARAAEAEGEPLGSYVRRAALEHTTEQERFEDALSRGGTMKGARGARFARAVLRKR